ncbi:hypothetical protein BKA56DRAFT_589443, partial [Ilyonectria sp. MPI-CAGE-AT-0026]
GINGRWYKQLATGIWILCVSSSTEGPIAINRMDWRWQKQLATGIWISCAFSRKGVRIESQRMAMTRGPLFQAAKNGRGVMTYY